METKTSTPNQTKKRKMLLLLPLLMLPFITLLFHILGGGRPAVTAENSRQKGFNFKLPLPNFKEDSSLDKMSYYDKAAADSIKLLEQIKKDPNYSGAFQKDSIDGLIEEDFGNQFFSKGRSAFNTAPLQGGNEKKLYQKIKALQKIISGPAAPDQHGQDMSEFENYGRANETSKEIKSLEQMMASMGAPQEPDPELQQLGGMLENILDIQHPSRVQERLKQSEEDKKGETFTVSLKKEMVNSTSLGEDARIANTLTNSFYSGDEILEPAVQSNAIQAVIHQTQSIVNGSVVKLRLKNDIMLQGTLIAKNTFLYGTASLKAERLEVKINSIQYLNSIFPVELTVYDLDGINGIYIPGAINRDAAKASAERSIQTLGLNGITDSWGAQAAGMGIEAAKSLMSKKIKLIRVVLKAGYQVLLYDEKQKNSNQ